MPCYREAKIEQPRRSVAGEHRRTAGPNTKGWDMTKYDMFRLVSNVLRSERVPATWNGLKQEIFDSVQPTAVDTLVLHELLWDLFLGRVLAFEDLPGTNAPQSVRRHTDWSVNLARMESELFSEL